MVEGILFGCVLLGAVLIRNKVIRSIRKNKKQKD